MPRWIDQSEPHPRLALLARSQGPLAVGVVVVTAVASVVRPVTLLDPELWIAWLLTAVTVTLSLIVPWERVRPAWAFPLSAIDFAIVGMFNHAVGPYLSATVILVGFPVLWLSYGFGRLGALCSLLGTILVIWLPDVLYNEFPRSVDAWSELVAITALLLLAVGVVALQAGRFKRSQRNLQGAVEARAASLETQTRLATILRTVADEVNVGLVFFDENRQPILDNRMARELAELSSYDGADNEASYVWAADGTTPLHPHEQPVVRVLAGGTLRDFLYWVGPAHQRRALLANGRPVTDQHGAYRGALIVAHDVTELMDALRIRADSLASLSHELRTPLTKILGFVELVLDNDDVSAAIREQLEVVHTSAQQVHALSEQFLAAGRSRGAVALEDVDLARLVGDEVEAHRDAAEAAGLTLRVVRADPAASAEPAASTEPIASAESASSTESAASSERATSTERAASADPTAPLLLRADRALLAEMFEALLDNAVLFTHTGGIEVRLETLADPATGRPLARVTISDTGVGVPAGELGRIFERFYRASNVSELSARGSGLGLPVAREIARAHNGSIDIDSVEGEGTTAVVTLPLIGDRTDR